MKDKTYIEGTVGASITRKARRYVESPDDAPDDVEVQEGSQGGLYYEVGGNLDGGSSGSDSEDVDVDVEDREALEELFEEGWDETTDDRGVLDEVDISFDEFAQRVSDIEQEMGGIAGTVTAAGIVINDLQDGAESESHEETDGDEEEGSWQSEDPDPDEHTLAADELSTNYEQGDSVTVQTNRSGEVSGVFEGFDYDDSFVWIDDKMIPLSEIESVE